MPKLKLTVTEKQNARILGVIGYYRNYYGLSHSELALAAHVNKDTLYSRLRKPQDFKVKELEGLAKKFRISITEFFDEDLQT